MPTLAARAGRRSRDRRAGAARRRDDGRGDAARQHDHEGLPQERRGDRPRRSRGGWYHTGDLARLARRTTTSRSRTAAKDIIISGGENISSLEVEECLYRHPQVMEAAVVARPDAKWGETPCAFVTLKPGAAAVDAADDHRVVPRASRALQGAEDRRVRPAAEDRDRQDPEVRAARARARCGPWTCRSAWRRTRDAVARRGDTPDARAGRACRSAGEARRQSRSRVQATTLRAGIPGIRGRALTARARDDRAASRWPAARSSRTSVLDVDLHRRTVGVAAQRCVLRTDSASARRGEPSARRGIRVAGRGARGAAWRRRNRSRCIAATPSGRRSC